MNVKRIMPIILSAVTLVTAVILSSVTKPLPTAANNVTVKKTDLATPDIPIEDAKETRGVWITYMELSMENESDKSEEAFTKKFDAVAKKCSESGFNTLVVQVRPFCDALYKSAYFPYSHILTGTQGENPGYDALKIMCNICGKYNLKIHAWVNPYRVKISETPREFSDDNPYAINKELCIETDSGIFLDPSSEKARELIINGITEIVENYEVDGIQFDDYFYPTDIEDKDKAEYDDYVKSADDNSVMDLETWRKFNVNLLVSQAYMAVHRANDNVVFGISPQGNINNNAEISADVVNWCCVKGFVDYICPQIYFSLDNPRLGFEESLGSWRGLELAEGVKLYAGLAGYKAGSDADEGTWLYSDDILMREYEMVKSSEGCSGIMLYSYSSLNDERAKKEIENLIAGFD